MEGFAPQLKKVWDEGTATPFVARLSLGILELRDMALPHITDPSGLVKKRLAFDKTFVPLQEALRDVRQSTKELDRLVDEHEARVAEGSIIDRQPHAIAIKETIDAHAGRLLRQIFDRGYTALKGVQAPLKELGLDIGWLFQKEKLFQRGIQKLRVAREPEFTTYLERVRASWSEAFLRLRAAHAHEGWVAPEFVYRDLGSTIEMQQPVIANLALTRFTHLTTNRLILFTENTIAYAVSRSLPRPLLLEEIPPNDRDPSKQVRFRLGLDQTGRRSRWHPAYSEAEDLV